MEGPTQHDHGEGHGEDDEEEAHIFDDEVLEVVEHDGDVPMDEDDEDGYEDQPVFEDVVDTSSSRFGSHGQAVFSLACHPSIPNLVASGGEDDLGYLWDASTGQELAKLTGHTDSVVAVGFSADGEMVATGGMDGKVRVWRKHDRPDALPQWAFLTSLEGPDEVVWIDWHPKGTILLAGGSDGTLWMWQLPQGRVMHVFAGHTGSVTCGSFTPDGKAIVTASDDNTLIVWDPRSGSPIHKVLLSDSRFPFSAPPSDDPSSSSGAASLAVNSTGSIAVVGSTSVGGVVVVNLVSGTIVAGLQGHDADEGTSVEGIEICEAAGGLGFIVTAGTDGKICIFDAGSYRLRSVVKHEVSPASPSRIPPADSSRQDAISSLVLHRSAGPDSVPLPIVTASSADAAICTWDLRTAALLSKHTGHTQVVHKVAWYPLGGGGSGFVVSGSEDGTARVWKVGA